MYNNTYNLFTISNKKSDIKGFWVDNNKVYIDNIKIKRFTNRIKLNKEIKKFLDSLIFITDYAHKDKLVSYFNKYLANKSFYEGNIFFRFFI